MKIFLCLGIVALAIFHWSCKPKQTNRNTRHTVSSLGSTPQAPAPQQQPCLQIVNGQETSDFPSVVLIHNFDEDKDEWGLCTGTFVSHNTVITAAHCLSGDEPKNMFFVAGNKFDLDNPERFDSVKAKKVFYNGRLDTEEIITDSEGILEDLAILIFPDGSAPAMSKLYPGTPPNRVSGTLVGYGVVGLEGGGRDGIKRMGTNPQVFSDPNETGLSVKGILTIVGNPYEGGEIQPGQGSLTDHGDSGGPLFINGYIAGASSYGYTDPDQPGPPTSISAYTDLNSKTSKELIAKAEQAGAMFARVPVVSSNCATK